MKSRDLSWIIMLFVSIQSCNNSNEQLEYYEDGSLEKATIFTSKHDTLNYLFKEYYASGILKREGEIVNGLPSGVYQEYHEDGSLKERGKYRLGVLHGCKIVKNSGSNFWQEIYILKGIPKQQIIHFPKSDSLPQALKALYVNDDGSTKQIGHVVYIDDLPNPEKSFYYEVICPDTLKLNQEAVITINGLVLGRDDYSIEVTIESNRNPFGLDNFNFKSDSLKLSIKLQPDEVGYVDLIGYVELTNRKSNESYQFLLCEELFITEN
jgi:hypothetical protein